MFLTDDKVKSRVNELAKYRYRELIPLDKWSFTIDKPAQIGTYPSAISQEDSEVTIGDNWKGRDLYAWLSSDVTIPKHWATERIVGLFDFGATGGGNNSGFESLLFLNGKPYQGVDSNHKEVFLSNEQAGTTISLDFRLWSGLEGGGHPVEQENKFKKAAVACLDEKVDRYYFDARAIIGTVGVLDENAPVRHRLLRSLNQSLNKINWLNPGSEEFYESVYIAGEFLQGQLESMDKHHDVTFHCIGHTHIDVAWLWQLKHTREKSARSFSTVLRLMELYPEYVFLQSQPQLYEYIKEDYPEIYEQMKIRIQEGRWEADGGMWLEADCNIPSGESLVRQLLVGMNFLKKEFGKKAEFLWLPDVFGYSWALPQILVKSGLKTFMTTKISWNQYNRMPHDTFYWRGIDGSEILTHFITTTEPWPDSRYYTYNGYVTPQVIKESWESYKDKNINQDLLLSYGYGDGGGGVNRDMLEMRRRIEQMPGLPNAVPSTARDYFNTLHDNIEKTEEYVHTWDGELYLEFHRGTYTSQAFMKRMNRKLELLFRDSEFLSVVEGIQKSNLTSYPLSTLTQGWKIILRNQFHDIIPGSSINEVYQDAKEEYREAENICREVWSTAVASILSSTENKEWTVFNTSSWQRNDIVFIPIDEGIQLGSWVDIEGNQLLSQQSDNGWYVFVKNIPAMGISTIAFIPEEKRKQNNSLFKVTDDGISSPYYQLRWNESGQLTSLFDKENNREVLARKKKGNVLQVFEDKPLMFDAWDIDIFYQEKMEEITSLKSIKVIENGELQASVRFEWEYGSSHIEQDMILYSNSRRIDFKTTVDWHERQRLLKVAFPVEIRSTAATYDIQFGNVQRPTHWNTSWDLARFETVGHQWADLSEGGYGVSLLNDCKYGYDIKNNVMRLSLIKSPIHPDPYADQGKHEFTYSIFPHNGTWEAAKVVEEAWRLNNPLTSEKGVHELRQFSMVSCSENNIIIDAVKKAENTDEVVIRLHEFEGKRTKAVLNSDWNIVSWQECDLMENPISDSSTSTLEFQIKPYEIKTFLINFNKETN